MPGVRGKRLVLRLRPPAHASVVRCTVRGLTAESIAKGVNRFAVLERVEVEAESMSEGARIPQLVRSTSLGGQTMKCSIDSEGKRTHHRDFLAQA